MKAKEKETKVEDVEATDKPEIKVEDVEEVTIDKKSTAKEDILNTVIRCVVNKGFCINGEREGSLIELSEAVAESILKRKMVKRI